jgi:Golgi nucleoside diphosphatase
MAQKNNNSFDISKIPSSDYETMTLKYMFQSITQDYTKTNPDVTAEAKSLLELLHANKHSALSEIKAKHAFSAQLTKLIHQRVEYIKTHKLEDVELTATIMMAAEKPALVSPRLESPSVQNSEPANDIKPS